jgi:hypothetical protein
MEEYLPSRHIRKCSRECCRTCSISCTEVLVLMALNIDIALVRGRQDMRVRCRVEGRKKYCGLTRDEVENKVGVDAKTR